MNVYIINFETKKIEEVCYSTLINSYAEETTTPYGVGRVDHIREKYGYLIDGEEFIEEELLGDALETGKNLDGDDITIKEVTRYEAWTWGHQGSFPQFIAFFYTQEEAEEWLFKQAEYDYIHAYDAPEFFVTKEEAEDFLQSNF